MENMQEFKLTAPPADLGFKYHIGKLNLPSFDVTQVAQPLYLYRGDPENESAVEALKAAQLARHEAEMKQKLAAENEEDLDEDMAAMSTDEKQPSPDGKKDGKTTEDASKEDGDNKDQDQKKRRPFKRKSKVYYATKTWEASRNVRRRQYFPWLMEDSEGAVNMVGKLEGDQHSNYVLFVYNEEGGFTVIPIDEWYRFQPRITYRTLTVDEAEEQMNSKSVRMDRWMMHRKEGDQTASAAKTKLTLIKGETEYEGKKKNSMKGDFDEMLYDENFDDDEEYGDDLEDNPEERDDEMEQRQKRKQLFGDSSGEESEDEQPSEQKQKLRDEAKDTSKLLKKMKQKFLPADTEDEDPYASNDGNSSDASASSASSDFSSASKTSSRKQTEAANGTKSAAPKKRTSIAGVLSKQSSRAASPASIGSAGKRKNRETSVSSREGSPALSDASSTRPSKKIKKASGSGSSGVSDKLISKEEIVEFLKSKGGGVTDGKELIAFFARRIKKNDENKKILPTLLKQVATKSGSGFVLKQ